MSLKTTVGCLASWFAWTSLAAAQEVLLPPSKTNTLIQVTGTDVEQLSNGLGDIYVGRTNQDGQGPATISIRRGLIEFNIAAAIPAGATITGVTLTVDDVRGLNGDQAVSLSRMLRDWGQGTSDFNGGAGAPATNGDATWYYAFYNAADPSDSPTWSTPGGQAGVDYSASPSATTVIQAGNPNQFFSWSSAAMLTEVQQWLDSPATNFGWIMIGNESAGQTAKRFGGQDAPSGETPPQLAVQYDVPTWTWTGSAGSAWTTPGNWTQGSGFPGSGAAIVLGDSRSTSNTVDLLAAAPSISQLTFAGNQAIAITSTAPGGGQLTLDNGISPLDVVVSGSGEAIDSQVTVTLDSDAWITTGGSSDSLLIAGDIGDGAAAHGIVKDGLGTLTLAGDDTYQGATTVNGGILEIDSPEALPNGTSLTVGEGAALVFGSGLDAAPALAASSAAAVPEPSALVLLAVGVIVAGLGVWRPRLRDA